MTAIHEAVGLGGRLRAAREAAAKSLPDVVFELRAHWPKSVWVSSSTLSRLETGKIEEDEADPFLIGALSVIYSMPIIDLSAVTRAALDVLIASSRCILQLAS